MIFYQNIKLKFKNFYSLLNLLQQLQILTKQ